jgi:hypothetical protein
MKKFIQRVLEASAFRVARSAFALYSLFFFQNFPSYRFQNFFSAGELPLFDIAPLHSPIVAVALKVIFLISMPAFILGWRVEFTGLTLGFAQLILNFMYPGDVLSFSYYAPLAFIAFAVSERVRKSEFTTEPETALALFMSSVYLAAALHKLAHFNLMMHWLPYDLAFYTQAPFTNLCVGGDCAITKFAGYSVIPIELALGILFFFRQTRLYALLLSGPFHIGISAVAAVVRPIGILVLSTQCCVALLAGRKTVKDILADKRLHKTLFFALPLTLIYFIFVHVGGPLAGFTAEVVFNVAFFLPILTIAFWSLSDVRKGPMREGAELTQPFCGAYVWLALLLIFFAIWPRLEGYRKTESLGWAMFSGAYFDNPLYLVHIKAKNCPLRDYLPIIVRTSSTQAMQSFGSFDEELLRRFANNAKRSCPESEISTQSPTPIVVCFKEQLCWEFKAPKPAAHLVTN